jgi:hypothetical protein
MPGLGCTASAAAVREGEGEGEAELDAASSLHPAAAGTMTFEILPP